jgi:purine-nucleoside phosphorylase
VIDPTAAAREAALLIAARTGVSRHDIAIVLGSGWTAAAEVIGKEVTSLRAGEVPGFGASGAGGHASTIRSLVTPTGRHVLVLGARKHYYESRDIVSVCHGVRTAAAAGCSAVILTNAAGSIRQEWGAGSIVLISDHINLTGATPLVGPRFVDLTEAYSRRLRDLAHEIDGDVPEGVYAQFQGPQYETPAEVRAAATLGADLVGMSTALETVAARAEGLEVLAISLVTNYAAGVSGTPLSHYGVLNEGAAAAPRLTTLLQGIVARFTPAA